MTSLGGLVQFITDIQWFSKNQFIETFLVRIYTKLGLFLPLWLTMGFGLYYYLMRQKKKYYRQAKIVKSKVEDKGFHLGIRLFSLVFSGILAWNLAVLLWFKIQLFLKATPFTTTDPIFDKSIDFYLFKLPLYQQLLSVGIFLTFLTSILIIGFFLFLVTIRPPEEESAYASISLSQLFDLSSVSGMFKIDLLRSSVRKIATLGMMIFLMISAKYYLMSYELMYSGQGVAYGASYTDIHVTLLGYRMSCVIAFIAAFTFAFGLLNGNKKLISFGPILLIGVTISFGIGGLVVQQLVVEPDEISKESTYLLYNIDYTQQAFNLKDVTISEFQVEQALTRESLEANIDTVENIRINDARPLKQTYNQIQGIRLYYVFNDIDLDRYMIDGNYTQVFISPRELDQEKLPDQAKTWINMHLKYTHGYGLAMSPVNAVSDDGQPVLIFKNVPPVTTTDLLVTQPEIYFGEKTNKYIIVNTDEPEFDYPSGSDNVTTRYEGNAGIELGGLNKLLYAYRQKSMKLLVSSVVNSDSRIIFYRNIVERVRHIAPFLHYDANPYLVLNQEDGKFYWIIDAYTTSKYYPYSQPFRLNNEKVNYVRNSVKVVIDAYEGHTKFYIFDEDDPVVKTYDKIFTDLFEAKDQLPAGLLEHIRYPQDYFDLQTEVYRAYHVNNPVVFYNGEDIWDVANEKYMDGIQPIESNYVMFKLPNSDKKEFALIVPYTPREKPNMTSLLVARNDGEHYGQLYMYKFPKDKTVQGPLMIEARIDQDSIISPQFTLWGQKGSAVLRGNLIVVPIENSLLYVEPIYIKADNPNSLPEMKRVIVAYEDKVLMEKTLDEALDKIFGLAREEIIDDVVETEVQQLLEDLRDLFDENKKTMEEIEDQINQLEEILESMEE
jgi:uncharacterized membrane protein (UPF0182 family)